MNKPRVEKYANGKWDVRLPTGERLTEYIMGGNGRYFVITRDGQIGPCRTLGAAANMAFERYTKLSEAKEEPYSATSYEKKRALSWERISHVHIGS